MIGNQTAFIALLNNVIYENIVVNSNLKNCLDF